MPLVDNDFIGMAANRLDCKQSTLQIAKEEKIMKKKKISNYSVNRLRYIA